ncbi:hypothetical protein DICSQDRAFT_167857 [Dichomitus squalens LYAD-421 SS1]|uniref:uncharacterized protein n=1 Tax=Dichomitus squalens (strain LYAD-421) TaxID=732165 RepID=UPI0004414392|nr:uncharacterized protein DICSQDRAFT_167857 [Dichomitus squalens LYAD-421 SS1]EJF63807.1 hypothetical protein DICSQDRAFT_167857 [Dichomitus squalens LYAD-421 SS1]
MSSDVDGSDPGAPLLPASTSKQEGPLWKPSPPETSGLPVAESSVTCIAEDSIPFAEGAPCLRCAKWPIPLRPWFWTLLLLCTLIIGVSLEVMLSLNKDQGWAVSGAVGELLTCDVTRYALSAVMGPMITTLYSSLWIWTCASIYALQPYLNLLNASLHGESAESTIFLDYSQKSLYSTVYAALKRGDWLVVLAAVLVLLTSTLHHLSATLFFSQDVRVNGCGAFARVRPATAIPSAVPIRQINKSSEFFSIRLLALLSALLTLGGLVLQLAHRRARKGLVLPSKLSTIGAAGYVAAPLGGATFSDSLRSFPDEVDRTLSERRLAWDLDKGHVVVV